MYLSAMSQITRMQIADDEDGTVKGYIVLSKSNLKTIQNVMRHNGVLGRGKNGVAILKVNILTKHVQSEDGTVQVSFDLVDALNQADGEA